MGCCSSKLPREDDPATAVANPLATQKEDEAAAPREKAEKEAALAAEVEALKAAAPEEVRIVLEDRLDVVYANGRGMDETKRICRVAAKWLVEAHAAAHDSTAKKRTARLVLGVHYFAVNMTFNEVFDDPYKAGLKKVLRALGEPLREACERQGLCAELGGLKLPPHELVVADQASCAKAGVKHVLRSDMDGVVPRPQAWARDFDGADLALQLRRERVFIHVLVLMAKALNEDFHAAMREVLGPHVVAGEGVMARNKDGSWRLTQQKGYARMLWCVHVACRSPSFATTCLLLLCSPPSAHALPLPLARAAASSLPTTAPRAAAAPP